MGDKLKIDPDAVAEAAGNLKTLAEEVEQEWTSVNSQTSNDLSGIEVREFDFRLGLSDSTAFWARRVGGFTERVTDGAEYLETGAAEARAADADSEGGFVELEDAISPDEYTRDTYYEATGTERPETPGEHAVPVPGGEDVPVA